MAENVLFLYDCPGGSALLLLPRAAHNAIAFSRPEAAKRIIQVSKQ